MTKAQILLEPCTQCGAPVGERCRPIVLRIGVHLARLLAAGVVPNITGTRKFIGPVARPIGMRDADYTGRSR